MNIKYTKKTLARFVDDFNLPIVVFEPKIFSYYISLYNVVYDTKVKFKLLNDLFTKFDTGHLERDNEMLFQYSQKLQEDIISIVHNITSYDQFVNTKFDYRIDPILENIPKDLNEEGSYISIDLVKANYQALKYFSYHILNDDSLIIGSENYDEFISTFTEDEYFKQSKKFRQIVFSHLNPKRQNFIQFQIIANIAKFLLDYIDKEDIVAKKNDELIIRTDNVDVKAIEEFCFNNGIDVSIKFFHLKQFKPYNFYVKEFPFDNMIKFYKVPKNLMAQVYKYYFHLTVNNKDLMFYDHANKLLAKYCDRLKFFSP